MHLFVCVGVLKSFRSRIRSCYPLFASSVMITSSVNQKPPTASVSRDDKSFLLYQTTCLLLLIYISLFVTHNNVELAFLLSFFLIFQLFYGKNENVGLCFLLYFLILPAVASLKKIHTAFDILVIL